MGHLMEGEMVEKALWMVITVKHRLSGLSSGL